MISLSRDDLVSKVNTYILAYETAKKMYKNSIYYVAPVTVGCTETDCYLGFQNDLMDRLATKTNVFHYSEPTLVGKFSEGSYKTTLIIIFFQEINTAFHLFGLNKQISDIELFVSQDRCPCEICRAPWYSLNQFGCPCCFGCLKSLDKEDCNTDPARTNPFIRKARANVTQKVQQ